MSLASAFATDPLFLWLMNSTTPVGSRMHLLFRALIRSDIGRPGHLMFVPDGGGGAAMWNDSESWKTPTWRMLPMIPAFIRAFGRGLWRAQKLETAMERQHPHDPHYYLGVLGVAADRQGSGLGSALIQPMLDRCDAEGLPAYLENSNPLNTPFYGRHGFADRGLIDLPEGAPPLQIMWRDPR